MKSYTTSIEAGSLSERDRFPLGKPTRVVPTPHKWATKAQQHRWGIKPLPAPEKRDDYLDWHAYP